MSNYPDDNRPLPPRIVVNQNTDRPRTSPEVRWDDENYDDYEDWDQEPRRRNEPDSYRRNNEHHYRAEPARAAPKRQEKPKWIIPTVIGVVVLIVLGIVGFMFMKPDTSPELDQGPAPDPNPIPNPVPNPNPIIKDTPSTPEDIITNTEQDQITLNWATVSGATSYNIYWSTQPGVTKTNGNKIEVTTTSYIHKDLTSGSTYYYIVTAVNTKGESEPTSEFMATARLPMINGKAVLPELDITYDSGKPGNGLTGIYLYDLSRNELQNDLDSDPAYSFSVDANKAYILTAQYNGGQAISALTPIITGDLIQNINIDTEVALNLIIATEDAVENLDTRSNNPSLVDLLPDANQAVANLNAFFDDRNANNGNASRIADAVHAITMDKLNRESYVTADDLTETRIRAYGGGLQGLRPLNNIVNSPLIPYTPHFTFSRYNDKGEIDFCKSDLSAKRWDYLGTWAWAPHIVTGGYYLAYLGDTGLVDAFNHIVYGVFRKGLGDSLPSKQLTPSDLYCLSPSISPDQSKIVFSGRYFKEGWLAEIDITKGEPFNLFIMDIDGTNLKQLTFDDDPYPSFNDDLDGCLSPTWSPDGSEIIFEHVIYSDDENFIEDRLEVIDYDGANRKVLFDGETTGYYLPQEPKYSPDGSRVVFSAYPPGQKDFEIIAIPDDFDIVQNNMLWIYTNNTFSDTTPDWSYDGRFIIFRSNRNGEPGTLYPYLYPFFIINSYTGEVVKSLGNFANAGCYYGPRFTATEYVFTAVDGVETDSNGNVIINPGSTDARYNSGHVMNVYYREIIPAANQIGLDFSLPDWC